MKSLVAFAALAAAAAIAAPASAQTLPSYLAPVTYNAGVAYQSLNIGTGSIGAITIRAGADLGKYFGLEGEGSWGVDDHEGSLPNGFNTQRHLNDQYAGYGVVRYPVYENAIVFVRGGYGHTDQKFQATDPVTLAGYTLHPSRDSWNYGGGAQYLVDGKNGVRVDYTHFDFIGHGAQQTADTWSVGYVHKF